MNHDPYEALSKQLAEAVARRRPSRTRRRSAIIVALVSVSVGGGAVATAAVLTAGPTREDRIRAALSAGVQESMSDPRCRPLRRRAVPDFVDGSAPAGLTAALGVLRRSQTDGERSVRRQLNIGGRYVLAGTVREAHASDGSTFLIFVSRGGVLGFTPVDDLGCQMLRGSLAVKAADVEVKDDVRASAQQEVERVRRSTAGDSLTLSLVLKTDRYGRPGFGSASPIASNGGPPKLTAITFSGRGKRRFVVLAGLVADQTHSIRVRDRDARRDGTRTAPVRTTVRDNVYEIELPKGLGPRLTVEELDANDRVLTTSHPHF